MNHVRPEDGTDRPLTATDGGRGGAGSFSSFTVNGPGVGPQACRRVLLVRAAGHFRASTARRSWSLFILDRPPIPSFRASS